MLLLIYLLEVLNCEVGAPNCLVHSVALLFLTEVAVLKFMYCKSDDTSSRHCVLFFFYVHVHSQTALCPLYLLPYLKIKILLFIQGFDSFH